MIATKNSTQRAKQAKHRGKAGFGNEEHKTIYGGAGNPPGVSQNEYRKTAANGLKHNSNGFGQQPKMISSK